MPLLFISLCIATLLGFGGTAAAQNSVFDYGEQRIATLKSYGKTTFAASVAMIRAELQAGTCSPKSESAMISNMDTIQQFEDTHIAKTSKLNPLLPGEEYLLKEYDLEVDTINKVYIIVFFQIGDAALAAHCLDIADKYYRKITTITHNDIDMRRAQIGIDDVREKRRR